MSVLTKLMTPQVNWVMSCWCLSSTPLKTTFETSTISLTKLTTEESESEEFGPRAVESRVAVGTVVRATSQLDMLDRVVVFLTRLVSSKEQRYLFEEPFQTHHAW